MRHAYVDASALAKLVLAEPGSAEMQRWYIENDKVLCSRIGIVETRRAVGRHLHDPVHLDLVLRSVDVIEFDVEIARRAASIGPPSTKTLDAIHLASAVQVGPAIGAFVTYDDRLADAARLVGLPVVRPA